MLKLRGRPVSLRNGVRPRPPASTRPRPGLASLPLSGIRQYNQKHKEIKKKPTFRSAYQIPSDEDLPQQRPPKPVVPAKPKKPARDTTEGQKRKALIDTILRLAEDSVQGVVRQWDETQLDFDELRLGDGVSQQLGEGSIDSALNTTAETVAQEMVPNMAKELVESAFDDVMTGGGKDAMQEFFENRVQELVKATSPEVLASEMKKELPAGVTITAAEIKSMLAESKGTVEFLAATQLAIEFWKDKWDYIVQPLSKQLAAALAQKMQLIFQQKLEKALIPNLHKEVSRKLIETYSAPDGYKTDK